MLVCVQTYISSILSMSNFTIDGLANIALLNSAFYYTLRSSKIKIVSGGAKKMETIEHYVSYFSAKHINDRIPWLG